MELSKKAIQDLQNIYISEYGKKLSDFEANMLGNNLLNLFKVIFRPIKKTKHD